MKLLEIVSQNGFIFDMLGVIGIGLLGLAAMRLSKLHGSRNTAAMTWGALGLIIGRLWMVVLAQVVTPLNHYDFNPTLLTVTRTIPLILLTVGLAAIVWGFWSHQQEVQEMTEDSAR